MTSPKSRAGISVMIAAACAISACQTTSTPRQPAVISQEADRIRSQIAVSPEPLPSRPVYGQVDGCQYESNYTYPNGQKFQRAFSLRVAPVRNTGRMLFTVDYGTSTSTLLLGQDGRVHDFNLAQSDGSRWTAENYASEARSYASLNGWEGEVFNNFLVGFPHYLQQLWQPGATVATINAENGTRWAQMVYRGIGGPNNWRAAIIDIVRADGRLAGFSIVELRTMLPLLTIVRSQQGVWRLERTAC